MQYGTAISKIKCKFKPGGNKGPAGIFGVIIENWAGIKVQWHPLHRMGEVARIAGKGRGMTFSAIAIHPRKQCHNCKRMVKYSIKWRGHRYGIDCFEKVSGTKVTERTIIYGVVREDLEAQRRDNVAKYIADRKALTNVIHEAQIDTNYKPAERVQAEPVLLVTKYYYDREAYAYGTERIYVYLFINARGNLIIYRGKCLGFYTPDLPERGGNYWVGLDRGERYIIAFTPKEPTRTSNRDTGSVFVPVWKVQRVKVKCKIN